MTILTVGAVVAIDWSVPVPVLCLCLCLCLCRIFRPIDRPGHDLWSRQSEQGSPHGCGHTMTQHGWKRREFSADTITGRMDCHFSAGMITDGMNSHFPTGMVTDRMNGHFPTGMVTDGMDCHFPAGIATNRMPHPFSAGAVTGGTSRQSGICMHHKHRQTS